MAHKTENVQLAVSVLLLQEEGKWVAQCLEYDIAAQADSISGAKTAFVKALASQACVNIHHGKQPMEDVPRAPKMYYEQFKQAMKLKSPALPQMPFPVDVQLKEMAISA